MKRFVSNSSPMILRCSKYSEDRPGGCLQGAKLINEIGAGGLFGKMATIEKQRRSASIKTLAETSFLIIEGDDFVRLQERNSSIYNSVIRTLAGRIRKMLKASQ